PKQAESTTAEKLPAEFDVARIDPDGTSVFAGRTAPHATVTVLGDGREIGTAEADEQGEWTMAVDHKFASDDPDLAIVAKRPSQSKEPSKKPSAVATRAPKKNVPAGASSDQRETAAPPASSASEGEQRARQTAKTVTSNLLKNLEGIVETARTAAHRETALDAEAPAPPQVDDTAPVAVAAVETSPTVSPARVTTPQTPITSASPAVRKPIPIPITFVFNESTLTEDGRKAAALLLEYLQIKKFPKVSLTGHADERGSDELNLALSRERLATVERFLRESGLKGELELVPKGESEPFSGVERSEYELEDLYQLDRRVELIITR
ncbi:MAG: OmpA family protein, partial [Hyphomicrobium sp.]